jgi:hypothetical protein
LGVELKALKFVDVRFVEDIVKKIRQITNELVFECMQIDEFDEFENCENNLLYY